MGWRREGDFLIANKEAQPLIWPLREPPYVIRLEYRGTKGGLALGRDPQKNTVDLADPELAKLANPAEQWNYLQVAAVSGAASVWLNGTDVKSKFPIDAHAGQFFLNPGADLQVRNLRVRSLK